jgi:hypothetical protein
MNPKIEACGATQNDDGLFHYSECYCNNDQGCGYTHEDEYGPCAFCQGLFVPGQIICADEHNILRICPLSL